MALRAERAFRGLVRERVGLQALMAGGGLLACCFAFLGCNSEAPSTAIASVASQVTGTATGFAGSVVPALTAVWSGAALEPPASGRVVNLQPDVNCVHPLVEPNCHAGFCQIPAGCFIMGAARDEYGAYAESDEQVQVTFTHGFELTTFEVTNADWEEEGFEQPTRDQDQGRCWEPDCPVSNVDRFEAMLFLNRYSENRGLPACYKLSDCHGTFGNGPVCNRFRGDPEKDGYLDCDDPTGDPFTCDRVQLTTASPYECEGFRLPTEAEWEYAARAGTRTSFWSGDITVFPKKYDCNDDPSLTPNEWYCRNSGYAQHPVGQKSPNPWGLYDVLGNVSEWTGDSLYSFGYGQSPLTDPAGYWYDTLGYKTRDLILDAPFGDHIERTDTFVFRGGDYEEPAVILRSADRSGQSNADTGYSTIGFRIARSIL